MAGCRVGLIDGAFVVNPTVAQMEVSRLDLVIAGTRDAVLMIEGFCYFLTEEEMLAVRVALKCVEHRALHAVINTEQFVSSCVYVSKHWLSEEETLAVRALWRRNLSLRCVVLWTLAGRPSTWQLTKLCLFRCPLCLNITVSFNIFFKCRRWRPGAKPSAPCACEWSAPNASTRPLFNLI